MSRLPVLLLQPCRFRTVAYGWVSVVVGMLLMAVSAAGMTGSSVEIVAAGKDIAVPEDAKVVAIEKFQYSPASISVAQNATVVWKNLEPFDHDVTFKSSDLVTEELVSPKIGKGGKIVVRFTTTGEYRYYCHLHPFMEGTVRVKAE